MSDFVKGAVFFGLLIFLSMSGAAILQNIAEGQKECNVNTDCGGENYCGSDFQCHSYPSIEKTIVQNNFVVPAAILGAAIVLTALILKKRNER